MMGLQYLELSVLFIYFGYSANNNGEMFLKTLLDRKKKHIIYKQEVKQY